MNALGDTTVALLLCSFSCGAPETDGALAQEDTGTLDPAPPKLLPVPDIAPPSARSHPKVTFHRAPG